MSAPASERSSVGHTPGPWTITQRVSRSSDNFVDRVEQEANARLIATAPDLLAALREMVAMYDGLRDAIGQTVTAKLGRADAAIARAEGRS